MVDRSRVEQRETAEATSHPTRASIVASEKRVTIGQAEIGSQNEAGLG